MQFCVGEFLHLYPIKMNHHHGGKWSSGGPPWFSTHCVITHDSVSLNSWVDQDGLCRTWEKGLKMPSACICVHKRMTHNSLFYLIFAVTPGTHFNLASLLAVIAAIEADFFCKFMSGQPMSHPPWNSHVLKTLLLHFFLAFFPTLLSSSWPKGPLLFFKIYGQLSKRKSQYTKLKQFLLQNFSASVLIWFWISSSLCSPLKHWPLNSRNEGSCSYLSAALLPLSALGVSNSSVTSHLPSTATTTNRVSGPRRPRWGLYSASQLWKGFWYGFWCNSSKRRDGIGSGCGCSSQPESSPLLQN